MTIEERLKDMIADRLGVNEEQVKPEAQLVEDLGADSLDIVELVMELEDEFSITVDEDDQEKLKTVGQVVEYVKDKADE